MQRVSSPRGTLPERNMILGRQRTAKANDGLKRLVFVVDDCGRVLIGLFEVLEGQSFFLGDPFVCRFRSDIDIGIDPFAVRGTVIMKGVVSRFLCGDTEIEGEKYTRDKQRYASEVRLAHNFFSRAGICEACFVRMFPLQII